MVILRVKLFQHHIPIQCNPLYKAKQLRSQLEIGRALRPISDIEKEQYASAIQEVDKFSESYHQLEERIKAAKSANAAKAVGVDDSSTQAVTRQLASLQRLSKQLESSKFGMTKDLQRGEIQAIKTSRQLDDMSEKFNALKSNPDIFAKYSEELLGVEKRIEASTGSFDRLLEKANEMKQFLGDIKNSPIDLKDDNAQAQLEELLARVKTLRQELQTAQLDFRVSKERLSDAMKEIQVKPIEIGGSSNSKNFASGFADQLRSIVKESGRFYQEIGRLGPAVSHNIIRPFASAMSAFSKWKSAIGRLMFYRTINSAIRTVSEGLKTGTNNLYQYSNLVGTKFAPAMDSLATSSQYLKNSLGSMAAPLIQAVAPAVDYLIDKFVALLNVIGKVFAALTGQSVYTQAVNNQRKTLVSQSFVEISMKVGDPEAQAGAEITTNGQEPIADPEDLLDHTAAPVKYASLEPFLWILDGTFQLVGGENVEEYEVFIPAGETEALVTADGKELFTAT